VHALASSPARADGLGAAFTPGRVGAVLGTGAAVAASLLVGGPGPGAVALGAAALVAFGTSWYARRMLGGRTGDTLGATVALAELAVCLVLGAFWRV
jgi:cobalamin synthase